MFNWLKQLFEVKPQRELGIPTIPSKEEGIVLNPGESHSEPIYAAQMIQLADENGEEYWGKIYFDEPKNSPKIQKEVAEAKRQYQNRRK